jgi:putative ABC transport system substrate-binding protein
MNRRELIALVGGTAVSWPLGARAQQRRMHRIGALILGNADAESFRTEMREGLRKAGYVEGPDLIFDFRSAEGRIDLLPKIAAELAPSRWM